MIKFMLKLILPVILVVLAACVTSPKKQESNFIPPNWVTEPPKDSSAAMWGVGQGMDLEAAKRSALKDIAGKLRIAISANIESRITDHSGSIDRYASSRVLEDVQRTEFKNYALEKSVFLGQEYYALVKVDRRTFIDDAEQKLTIAEKEISALLDGNEAGNPIEKFVAQQKAIPWIEKAVSTSQILSAANPGFDAGRTRMHEASLSKAKSSSSNLIFDLRVGGDSSDVTQTFKNFLNDAGIRIGSGGTPLIIRTASTRDIIFGSNTIQLRINLSIQDAQGRSVASKEFIVNGASMADHNVARQIALKNLGEKLRELGPVQALGFAALSNN